jgi:hypothetical protein
LGFAPKPVKDLYDKLLNAFKDVDISLLKNFTGSYGNVVSNIKNFSPEIKEETQKLVHKFLTTEFSKVL